MAKLASTNVFGTLDVSNEVSALKVWSAVYNDYADYILLKKDEEIKAGMCYYESGVGLALCNKRNQFGAFGICSDTFGYATGKKNNAIPISVAGIVLAYVDQIYKAGTLLVNNKYGILTKAKRRERGILAMYIRKEPELKFKEIDVKNRHWVKVKS